ncbi:MAG TPA: EAL domain-containing protein [Rhodocyclaceae bacterium]|nr:EAL domain-containing protein [Rhodocyclaceae bacterium]
MLKLRPLENHIVLFFVFLLAALGVANWITLETVGASSARQNVADQLKIGDRIFHHSVTQNVIQLTQGARVLAADFAFRQAIATGDRGTITSALTNHGARIDAQLMMLVNTEQKIIADTLQTRRIDLPFFLPHLLGEAERQGQSSAIATLDGRLYQLVVVPVLAPIPIAWVVMGFAIDEKTVQGLSSLTGLQVSFLSRHGEGLWKMCASSLPASHQQPLIQAIGNGTAILPFSLKSGDESGDYLTLVARQSTHNEEVVIAVLQKSEREAIAPIHDMVRNALLLSLLGIAIAMIGSVAIARTIARPVADLAGAARRIEGGDYAPIPITPRKDEIGDLAVALDHMREGIASREARITELAYRDSLTHLPNRLLFNDRLQQAIAIASRRNQTLAILLLNLDRFRLVNDALGHANGDILLREVASRLQRTIRRKADTVARLGGDEFAMLLPDESANIASMLAGRLLQDLEQPFAIANQPVDVRASIGVVTYPLHGDTPTLLLRHADIALSMAKRNNTGHAVFDPRFEENNIERLSLMGELRTAVEQDQLVMHYQPKIDITGTGSLHAEALVRWQHPQRGFVPPFEFIPFAEQTGYIKAITLWVLDRCLAQCGQWRQAGRMVSLSVNLSTRDLLNPELATRLKGMLETHRCQAEWFTLEITESAIIDDPHHALANLDQLHQMGFHLSIDDFGTGYSSLSYLKRLPVDELKIDKSFVMGMVHHADDHTIVRSTIDLAHNMGLRVVAEGVETREILDALRSLGCDVAQGYLISKPVSDQDFERWMEESPWRTHTV